MQAIQIPNEQQLSTTVSGLCAAASDVIILGREDLSDATDLVKVIKTRHKEIEDERTAIVKPINDSVKHINARFKAILEPLEKAESEVKGKMLAFQQEENLKAEEARKEAERTAAEEAARIAADRPDPVAPAPLVPLPVPPISQPTKTVYGQYGGSSTVKKVWSYELVDIAALAAARPDLVAVDAGKINAEIRGRGGDIPGLRIFEKETIAVR